MGIKNVFLITKLKTTNIGNEALSNEIIKLFSSFTEQINLQVNGRPDGLDGYYPRRIANKKKPEFYIEKWSDEIVKKIKKEKKADFKKIIPRVKLLRNNHHDFKNDEYKAKLRPFKRWLVSFTTYSGQYQERAIQLNSADWLIYSGAGEVGDYHVFLRQLVEIRVAQKLGVKTAAINQSVVIKTDMFKKLIGHVYGKMNKIVIRGETSRQNLIGYGVPEKIIEVAPDSSINSITSTKRKEGLSNLVAINITPKVAISNKELDMIIQHLQHAGKKIIFVTNEPYEDSGIAKHFFHRYHIDIHDKFKNYHEYIEKLAECDFVISARLHTNMLSLVSETPVIPIEGNVFKTRELLDQLQYPVTTLNSGTAEWVDRLRQEIDHLISNHYDFKSYFGNVFPIHKKAAEKNAAWILGC